MGSGRIVNGCKPLTSWSWLNGIDNFMLLDIAYSYLAGVPIPRTSLEKKRQPFKISRNLVIRCSSSNTRLQHIKSLRFWFPRWNIKFHLSEASLFGRVWGPHKASHKIYPSAAIILKSSLAKWSTSWGTTHWNFSCSRDIKLGSTNKGHFFDTLPGIIHRAVSPYNTYTYIRINKSNSMCACIYIYMIIHIYVYIYIHD